MYGTAAGTARRQGAPGEPATSTTGARLISFHAAIVSAVA
jgi:hypothetical protein